MATKEINLANIPHGFMSTNTNPLVCRECSGPFDRPLHSVPFSGGTDQGSDEVIAEPDNASV